MATTSNLTLRISADLKKEAEELFHDFGLTLNGAFNMFLKQSVREQRIPFAIARNQPSPHLLEAIAEVDAMEADPTLRKSYTSVKSMFEEILADE